MPDNKEFKQKLIDDLKTLDEDLALYKESLKEYRNIPEGAEVGEDYHEALKVLEEVAEKLESLPKKLDK